MGCGGSKAASAASSPPSAAQIPEDNAKEASTPKKRASLAAVVANPVSTRRLLTSPATGVAPASPASAPGPATLAKSPAATPASSPETFVEDALRSALETGELDLGHPDGKVGSTHPIMKAIPAQVFEEPLASKLTSFRFAGNDLREAGGCLPSGISKLTALKSLDVANCKLKSLPDDLPPTLEELVASENILTALPDSLPSGLQVLSMFKNNLTALPASIGRLKALREINAFNNQITSLPEEILQCSALEDVNFGSNQLFDFPEIGDSWPSCRRLALQWNKLARLPSLAALPLETLQIDGNGLQSWPAFSPSTAASLKTIDASKNKLGPSSGLTFKGMESLTKLDLSTNELEVLPDDLGDCRALETFTVSNNKLATIPSTVGQCVALKALIGVNSGLRTLPEELGSGCPALTRLVLDKCELDSTDPATAAALAACRKKCSGRDGRFRV